MAKRRTGVGKGKRTHSKKTAKRLAIKKQMLEEKSSRTRKKRKERKKRKKKG